MSRGGFERPPRWAAVVLVVGLVLLAVGGYVAVSRRQHTDPTSAAALARMRAAASAADASASAAASAAVLRITVPPTPHLLILGDSFTRGYAADPPTKGWAYLVADKLGWDHRIDGVAGTGFTAHTATGQAYGDRIRRLIADHAYTPNVVVLQGGLNDYTAAPQQLQAAVRDDVTQLRAAFPGVQVVIFGPVRGWIPGIEGTQQTAGTIGVAADQLRVPYINPYDSRHVWVTRTNTAEFVAKDGAHPNTRGHQMLADWFMQDFRRITSSRG